MTIIIISLQHHADPDPDPDPFAFVEFLSLQTAEVGDGNMHTNRKVQSVHEFLCARDREK